MSSPTIPSLPRSWSELSWTQLTQMWTVKMRYGGNPDVARVAALLELTGLELEKSAIKVSQSTGETLYRLRDKDGCQWTVTAREAAQLAKKAIPWFDFPYGDHGETEERDAKGVVTRERREPVAGYVSGMQDAMILQKDEIMMPCTSVIPVPRRYRYFALPGAACNNMTYQQYLALQSVAPRLFSGDLESSDEVIGLQAQFLAHCLVPRSVCVLDTDGGSIRIRPHYEYKYNAVQAERLEGWWQKLIRKRMQEVTALFYICFQCYQTALAYYAKAYPLLFSGGKNEQEKDGLRDALLNEVGTVNTVMKYAGYAEQQQVYDSNLPFILDILNTMTREAKEIEKMNAKIKKK